MKDERGKWHMLAHPLEIYISCYPDKISTQRLGLKERPLRVLCESTTATLRSPQEGWRGLIKVGKANPARPEQSPQEDMAAPPGPRPTPNTTPHRHSPSSSPWGCVSSAGAEASSEFRTEKICKETTIMRVSEVSVHTGWTLRIAYTPRSTKPHPSTQ